MLASPWTLLVGDLTAELFLSGFHDEALWGLPLARLCLGLFDVGRVVNKGLCEGFSLSC